MREVEEFHPSKTGVAAFLISENSFRPLTVDSAIFKGGSDITWQWSNSPLMDRAFARRRYFVKDRSVYRRQPPDLTSFDFVVIARPKRVNPEDHLRRMEDHFSVSLAGFSLVRRFDLTHQDLDVLGRSWHSAPGLTPPGRMTKAGSDAVPLNENFAFLKSTSREPLRGFSLSHGDSACKASLVRDRDGRYVRVLVRQPQPYVVVYGLFHGRIVEPHGMLVRAQVRARCQGAVRLTIFDVTGRDGAAANDLAWAPCSGEWITVEVRRDRALFPHPSDNYSVGLSDAKPGDWFEIREFSLYRLDPANKGTK